MDDLFQDDENTKKVDYAELLQQLFYRAKIILRRHWWVIPSAIALGISFKAIVGFLEEPFYKSTSQMIVSGRIALPENDVYAEERDNFFGTQIELMLSEQVQARAVERVRLMDPDLHEALTATEAYQADGLGSLYVDADVKRDTSIFVLKAYAPHAEYTQAYLDAVMEEYINRRVEMRSKTSERTYDAILAQLKVLETEVDAGEDAIVEFQQRNNIVFIKEQGSAAGAYLAELKRELAELNTESRLLFSIQNEDSEDQGLLLDQLQGAEGALSTAGGVFGGGSAEDTKKYLLSKEQLQLLHAQLEEFSIYLKPKHPKIIGLKNQIERTENQLDIQRGQALERIRERQLVVENRIKNLNLEIAIWEKSALENGRLIAEFERLQSRLTRSKEAYARNQDSLRAIDSNQNLQQDTVAILVNARTPRPAGVGLVRQFTMGALYGIVLAGGVLFVLGALDNRILTANELSAQFSDPLVGAIPFEVSNNGDAHSVLLRKNDDRYVFAEACRNLRTSVFFMGDEHVKPSTFAVTSAVPSEGKSTVSANLAVALSFAHSKVLLVDADLRRGRLHHLLKLNRENGLSDVLKGTLTFDSVIQSSSYEHLDFVSIGGYPDHPAELLMGARMDAFIREAKERYDFVVFDTAPILATDDTSGFAGKMDAVLFTIRCAYTQVRQIKPAMARLRERNVDISGLILNYVDTTQPGYYYYRYSEYYTDSKNHDTEAVSQETSA
jgi:capsular exopolysaccharide synthesis family protein